LHEKKRRVLDALVGQMAEASQDALLLELEEMDQKGTKKSKKSKKKAKKKVARLEVQETQGDDAWGRVADEMSEQKMEGIKVEEVIQDEGKVGSQVEEEEEVVSDVDDEDMLSAFILNGGVENRRNMDKKKEKKQDYARDKHVRVVEDESNGGFQTAYSRNGMQRQAAAPTLEERDGTYASGEVCFRCGTPGHFARECTAQPKPERLQSGTKCYHCGNPGHFARECPLKAGEWQPVTQQRYQQPPVTLTIPKPKASVVKQVPVSMAGVATASITATNSEYTWAGNETNTSARYPPHPVETVVNAGQSHGGSLHTLNMEEDNAVQTEAAINQLMNDVDSEATEAYAFATDVESLFGGAAFDFAMLDASKPDPNLVWGAPAGNVPSFPSTLQAGGYVGGFAPPTNGGVGMNMWGGDTIFTAPPTGFNQYQAQLMAQPTHP